MSRPPKTVPVVIRFKKWKALVQAAASPKIECPKPSLWKHAYHLGGKKEGPSALRKQIEPDSHRNAWVSAFGTRLKIDEQKGFFLDGLPIGLDALMLETNRLRRASGLEPVGKNPRWIP